MSELSLAHIVAMAEGGVIGRGDQLPWKLADDMRHFMQTTRGHAVIMGRKTFETLRKPLVERLNIVVTRQQGYAAPDGVIVVSSVDEALAEAKAASDRWGDEVFIAGGGEIYRATRPLIKRLYLTEVHQRVEGDTTYELPPRNEFKEVSRERHEGAIPFSFVLWERVAPSAGMAFGANEV